MLDTMKISMIFIKEPLSLELLLYLLDNKITKDQYMDELKEIDPKLDIDNLLTSLKELKLIYINKFITLTTSGRILIKKLSGNMSNRKKSTEQDGITTIQLYRTTKRKLDDKKKTGESYNDVIKRIIGD